jgi:hypothetical protein
LALVAETMSDEQGIVVMRLAMLAQEQCKTVEAKRRELFRLSHPNAERFNAVGWPSEEKQQAA